MDKLAPEGNENSVAKHHIWSSAGKTFIRYKRSICSKERRKDHSLAIVSGIESAQCDLYLLHRITLGGLESGRTTCIHHPLVRLMHLVFNSTECEICSIAKKGTTLVKKLLCSVPRYGNFKFVHNASSVYSQAHISAQHVRATCFCKSCRRNRSPTCCQFSSKVFPGFLCILHRLTAVERQSIIDATGTRRSMLLRRRSYLRLTGRLHVVHCLWQRESSCYIVKARLESTNNGRTSATEIPAGGSGWGRFLGVSTAIAGKVVRLGWSFWLQDPNRHSHAQLISFPPNKNAKNKTI